MSCKICFEDYNDSNRKPESLIPCGHTFCKECLGKLNRRECATCKVAFHSTITVWDMIPTGEEDATSERLTDDERRVKLRDDMFKLSEKFKQFEASFREENEHNGIVLGNIEKAIDQKAEELLNRVIDEQTNLKNKLKSCKTVLEQEKAKKIASLEQCESQLKKIADQVNAHLDGESEEASSATQLSLQKLQKDVHMQLVRLDKLKLDFQTSKQHESILFEPKVYVMNKPLLGLLNVNINQQSLTNHPNETETANSCFFMNTATGNIQYGQMPYGPGTYQVYQQDLSQHSRPFYYQPLHTAVNSEYGAFDASPSASSANQDNSSDIQYQFIPPMSQSRASSSASNPGNPTYHYTTSNFTQQPVNNNITNIANTANLSSPRPSTGSLFQRLSAVNRVLSANPRHAPGTYYNINY